MNRTITDIIAAIVMTLVLIGFKYFNGFENTILLIASMGLVELWKLNGKK